MTAEISAGLRGALSAICADADLIVLANLLSQIPIAAFEARRREARSRLGAQLIETHLAALDAHALTAERACVITDTVQREEDRHGLITVSLNLMFSVALPNPNAAWDWVIASSGEIGRHRRLIHRVHACLDWRTVRARAPDTKRAALVPRGGPSRSSVCFDSLGWRVV